MISNTTPARRTPIISVIYPPKELIISFVELAIFPTKSVGNVIIVSIIGYADYTLYDRNYFGRRLITFLATKKVIPIAKSITINGIKPSKTLDVLEYRSLTMLSGITI